MPGPIDDNQKHVPEEAVQQFVDAQLQGREPEIDEFVKRYPEFQDQIRKRIGKLNKLDTLFSSLVQVDENDFGATATGPDLAGRKIGSFEIEEMIGRGGMGVVYLAHDTKLDRSVAIKSMPAELQANSTAQMRFKREAKLLVSLNHPNIAVIHDIIEQEDDHSYLVLEYIPGQTLAEHIAHKPLRIGEALSIGRQIAEALLGAYEQGVAHRDLKSDNIKITPEGRVKVLDFGLAKAIGTQEEKPQSTITQAGRIVGTPAYMSPEQARGNPTDHRTDIWSFGCVMYEMLTGRLPFEGATATDTVARVLEREPDWQALPPETPVNVRVLLRRCLEKDPRRRLQHIGDAGIEIGETLNQPASEAPIIGGTLNGTRASARRRTIGWTVTALLGMVVTLFVGMMIKDSMSPSGDARPPAAFIVPIPNEKRLEIAGWNSDSVVISPDGALLVYVASQAGRSRLFLRPMGELEAKPIPGTKDARNPFFSPDGESIAFYAVGKLKKVSLKSEDVQELCDVFPVSFGGTWGLDDMIYFTWSPSTAMVKVSADGGQPESLNALHPDVGRGRFYFPHLLPGGQALLLTVASRAADFEGAEIAVLSLDSGTIHPLGLRGIKPHYTASGHIVFARAGKLMAAPFDLERRRRTGSSVPVRDHVMTYPASHFSVSSEGSLVYISVLGGVLKNVPVWVNREGVVDPLPASITSGYYRVPRLSPNGKQLAVAEIEQDGWDIYRCDLLRGGMTRLTFNEDIDECPVWEPNGLRITYISIRQKPPDIFWVRSDASDQTGGPLFVSSGKFAEFPTSWSSDGRYLLFTDERTETQLDIAFLDREKGLAARPLLKQPFNETAAVFHPGGNWIAYAADEETPGRYEVYALRFPTGDVKVSISVDGGEEPVWDRSGKAIYYRQGDRMMVVTVEATKSELSVSPPEVLFSGRYASLTNVANYDIDPNGRRFMMIKPVEALEPTQINVVLNWSEELKHLVLAHGD